MKKNIMIISVFLIISVLLCASSTQQNNIYDKPLNRYLVTRSIELTCTMSSLAQSSEYIMMITPQQELKDFIEKLGADEYTSPNKSVLIKISEEAIGTVIENSIGKLSLPEDAYEMVVTRMCSSIPTIINATQGVNAVAATSILSVGKAFPEHKDFEENTYVVLCYDNYSSVTFFRKSTEGITSVSTIFLFLPDDMKTAVTEETVNEYLAENFNIDGIEIEYIDRNKLAEYR